MGIVKCPNCGHKVTDRLGKCPNCGEPFEEHYPARINKTTDRRMKKDLLKIAEIQYNESEAEKDEATAKRQRYSFELISEAAGLDEDAKAILGMMYVEGVATEKDVKKGLAMIFEALSAGSTEAALIIAAAHMEGNYGLDKSPEKAVKLYEMAADAGNTVAMYNLGIIYTVDKYGIPLNIPEGVRRMKDSADLGYEGAQFLFGVYNEYGELGLEKNIKAALKYYKMAAEQGNCQAAEAYQRLKGIISEN